MNSSNFRKPIGANVTRDISTQVGGTYGERRKHFANNIAPEAQVRLPQDVFGTNPNEREKFSPNASFQGNKTLPAHKLIEAGQAQKRPRISDEARLSILNNIISNPAANVAPKIAAKKRI